MRQQAKGWWTGIVCALSIAAWSPASAATQDEVRIPVPGTEVVLAATLATPEGDGPWPGVVLVTGAGPQDRDETVAGQRPFRVLSDALVARGIAVLRYDDRGVAASTGQFATATLFDFARDAGAAAAYLAKQPGIDAARVGLVGHSEGGLVAPLVVRQAKGGIAFVVLVASPGRDGEATFLLQDAAEGRASGVDEAAIQRQAERKHALFAVLKADTDPATHGDALRTTMRNLPMTDEERAQIAAAGVDLEQVIAQQVALLDNDATRVFLRHDPLPPLRALPVPALALFAGNDLQVPLDTQMPPVRDALSARTRCTVGDVVVLPGLNHLFQASDTGLPREYASLGMPFVPAATTRIADWILSRPACAQAR
jgi:uncharacterized protein